MIGKKWIMARDYLDAVDIHGNIAGTIILTGTRSGGKTTGMLKLILENNIDYGENAVLCYRKQSNVDSLELLFDDVLEFYPKLNGNITAKRIADKLIYAVYRDDIPLVYGICLKQTDDIKKFSPLFRKTSIIVMDEYQSEDGKYLDDEFDKLTSLILTVSRGGGRASRDIKVFLLGNNVTLMNPYFLRWNIHKKYRQGTKRIRGNGFCAYFLDNEYATKQIQNNQSLTAFSDTKQFGYATHSDFWLADSSSFIEHMTGKSRFLCILLIDGYSFGIWDYFQQNIIYISQKYIENWKYVFTFNNDRHNQKSNSVLISKSSYIWKRLETAYAYGNVRFADLESRNAFLTIYGNSIRRV